MFFRCYNTRALPQLRNRLLHREPVFTIYELDGKSIHDKRSLFEAFRLNTPYAKKVPSVGLSWDAFCECLEIGLKLQGDPYVAILWPAAETLIDENLVVLLELVEMVQIVGDELSRAEHPIQLQVFLLGDGPSFFEYPEDGKIFSSPWLNL